MKKYIPILSLLVLCVWSISAVSTAKADTAGEEVSYQELGTETPKLLPNNPFHFIKEWNWNIKRAFTFNPEKRTELELKISNEQAAEIKRLQEVDPNNVKAIGKAVNNYQDNIERLKNRLEAIKETGENLNVDNLLDKLTDNSLNHQRIFDNLKIKLEENSGLKEKIENIQNRIDDVILKIPEKFENSEKFKERIQAVIEKQPQRVFKELQTVELLERLEEKLPEDGREHIQNFKEEMISRFKDKIQALGEVDREKLLNLDIIKKLPGDNLRRINILEQIGENTSSTLKTEIREIKEGLINNIDSQASRERILKLIAEAKDLIAKVEKFLSENLDEKIINSIKVLLEGAKTHLVKANKALDENKIGEAFGQANSAISTAKNAMLKIQRPNGNTICIQVITPAVSPEGVCKNFPTPCDVPAIWKKTDKCLLPAINNQNDIQIKATTTKTETQY